MVATNEISSIPEATKSVAVTKPVEESDMDTSENSRVSLIADGVIDDSMFESYVVDEDSKITGTVTKETAKSKVGISLQKSKANDAIVIAKIKEGGLFAATDLQIGQIVLSINGHPCPTTTAEVLKLVTETVGDLTIEAADMKKKEDPMLGPIPDEAEEADPLSAPPAEIDVQDSESEPASSGSSAVKLMSGVAVATGTVLVGALVAGGTGGSSGSSIRRFPTKN